MITLTILSNINDAFILRSMLEANDIPSFLPDENICQSDWEITASAGVRVQIPEGFEEKAKIVLAEFRGNSN